MAEIASDHPGGGDGGCLFPSGLFSAKRKKKRLSGDFALGTWVQRTAVQ